MSQTRIYVVTDTDTDTDDSYKFLVRAASKAQAIAHLSKRFSAEVASQEQLVKLMGGQVLIETAGRASA